LDRGLLVNGQNRASLAVEIKPTISAAFAASLDRGSRPALRAADRSFERAKSARRIARPHRQGRPRSKAPSTARSLGTGPSRTPDALVRFAQYLASLPLPVSSSRPALSSVAHPPFEAVQCAAHLTPIARGPSIAQAGRSAPAGAAGTGFSSSAPVLKLAPLRQKYASLRDLSCTLNS